MGQMSGGRGPSLQPPIAPRQLAPMSVTEAGSKLAATLRLGGDGQSRRRLLGLFGRRYHYPGARLLRALAPAGRTDLALRVHPGAPPCRLALRAQDAGDVASLFETFVEYSFDPACLAAPRLAVDAGAHIGCFSLFLHAHFPGIEVHAIEPEASNLALLRENFATNAVVGEVHAAALWTRSGPLAFQLAESNAGRIAQPGDSGTLTLNAVTLPDLLGPRLAELAFLKLDIEGAEREVIPALLPLLPAGCIVFAEVHDTALHAHTVTASIEACGWQRAILSTLGPHACYLITRSASAPPLLA